MLRFTSRIRPTSAAVIGDGASASRALIPRRWADTWLPSTAGLTDDGKAVCGSADMVPDHLVLDDPDGPTVSSIPRFSVNPCNTVPHPDSENDKRTDGPGRGARDAERGDDEEELQALVRATWIRQALDVRVVEEV